MANHGFLEDPVPDWRDGDGPEKAVHAKLPCFFTLSSARIDASHQKYDVEGGQGVEYLGGR